VTSFIDMPNTVPIFWRKPKRKVYVLQKKVLTNYLHGVNGDNIDEIIKTDTSQFIGVSDDGLYYKKNLLADNPETMEKLFANCKSIIAIHSEKKK
jgi:dihydroorotase